MEVPFVLELRERLLQTAQDEGIRVEAYPVRFTKAFLAEGPKGYCIALDPFQINSLDEEVYLLAHELGHYFTGSLYGLEASSPEKGRCEYRANLWTARALCPPEKLRRALAAGCRMGWELAEELSLPEPMVAFALALYHNNGWR
jgi:hypothetical protein